MGSTRREFVLGGLGAALATKLNASGLGRIALPSADANAGSSAYGSGHFGTWIEDEFGLPAFQYTCNQTSDPRAVTKVQPGVLAETEHIHQVGNDRIIAIASNYGHVRVRQDEGAPKFLNDVDPETSQFGGGLGYLTDGAETLSTHYDGSNGSFERIFGVGYYKKKVRGKGYSIDQVISAPFGDDPVLISEATITNHRSDAATVRWVEYWGCQPYQFSFRPFNFNLKVWKDVLIDLAGGFHNLFTFPSKYFPFLAFSYIHIFRFSPATLALSEAAACLGLLPNKALQLTPSRLASTFHDRPSFPFTPPQKFNARSG